MVGLLVLLADGERLIVTRTVSAAVAVALGGVLPVYLVGALAVQLQQDIGLSTSTLGGGASAFFGASVVASVCLGGRLERFGWPRAMAIAAFGHVITLVGISVAAHSVATLFGLLALGGVAHAIGMPAGNIAISDSVTSRHHALVFSVRQSAFPVASMLAGVAVPTVALTIGWRWAFGIGLIAPVATLFLVRRARGGAAVAKQPGSASRIRLRSPGFAAMSVAVTLGASVVNISTAFLVSGAVASGASSSRAGHLLVYGGVAAIGARLISGVLVDRTPSRGFAPMAALLVAGACGLALLATGRTDVLPLAALLTLGGGTGWAGLMHYILISEWAQNPGQASAAMLGFAYAGGAIAPTPFGMAAETFGFGPAWSVAALLALTAAASAIVASRLLERERDRHDSVLPRLPA